MPNDNEPAPTTSKLRAVICPVTPFQQNCSLIWCDETKAAAFVDPGGQVDDLLRIVEEQGVTLEKIFITHGHIDHAGGAAELSERMNIPIEGPHTDDSFWIDTMETDGPKWGLPEARCFAPTRWLDQGDTVTLGKLVLDVYHCPGHTPGHVIFHHPGSAVAFVGDVLFKGSIGRTDFPRGNHADLINAIITRLWPLGDETTFVPGHGELSTFGNERMSNPYVSDRVLKFG